MKTTVDLPDELYRRAKAEAALRGQKFRELVAEGLARMLEAPAEQRPKANLSTLMKRARGVKRANIPRNGLPASGGSSMASVADTSRTARSSAD